MRESPEIVDAMRRFMEALSRGGTDAVLGAHASDPRVVLIGTDEDEWFEGGFPPEEVGTFRAEPQEMRAFEEGSVGWGIRRVVLTLEDGTRLPIRVTAVYHREDGEWKIVHEHTSVARAGS
jgi:ketosteroid isomerase-like protein